MDSPSPVNGGDPYSYGVGGADRDRDRDRNSSSGVSLSLSHPIPITVRSSRSSTSLNTIEVAPREKRTSLSSSRSPAKFYNHHDDDDDDDDDGDGDYSRRRRRKGKSSHGFSRSTLGKLCLFLTISCAFIVWLRPNSVHDISHIANQYHAYMTLGAISKNSTTISSSSNNNNNLNPNEPQSQSSNDPFSIQDIAELRTKYLELQQLVASQVKELHEAKEMIATCATERDQLRNVLEDVTSGKQGTTTSGTITTSCDCGGRPYPVNSPSSAIDLKSHERVWLICPNKSPRHTQVLKFCKKGPTSEQHYQLSFFDQWNSQNVLVPMFKRPDTPNCIQLPPPGYIWPNRTTILPSPPGNPAVNFHNLRVNKLEDLKVFNPSAYKNLYHFDAPRYDVEFQEEVKFGEKYIPLATKIRLALDVGSGGGSFGLWLKYKFDIQTLSTAFPDWPYCEYIMERGNLCMYLDAFHSFPFAKFSFDLVHVSWVYHSMDIPELEASFRELYRITRPGGYLWLSDGWSKAQVDMMDELFSILGLVVLYDRRVPHRRETYFGKNPYEVQWWTILLKPIRVKYDPACRPQRPGTGNITSSSASSSNVVQSLTQEEDIELQ